MSDGPSNLHADTPPEDIRALIAFDSTGWVAWQAGLRQGVELSARSASSRADEIEAEGSASIFAGAIVSELRQQAQRLRDLYVEGK